MASNAFFLCCLVMTYFYQALFISSKRKLLKKKETKCVCMHLKTAHPSFCVLFAEDACVVFTCPISSSQEPRAKNVK